MAQPATMPQAGSNIDLSQYTKQFQQALQQQSPQLKQQFQQGFQNVQNQINQAMPQFQQQLQGNLSNIVPQFQQQAQQALSQIQPNIQQSAQNWQQQLQQNYQQGLQQNLGQFQQNLQSQIQQGLPNLQNNFQQGLQRFQENLQQGGGLNAITQNFGQNVQNALGNFSPQSMLGTRSVETTPGMASRGLPITDQNNDPAATGFSGIPQQLQQTLGAQGFAVPTATAFGAQPYTNNMAYNGVPNMPNMLNVPQGGEGNGDEYPTAWHRSTRLRSNVQPRMKKQRAGRCGGVNSFFCNACDKDVGPCRGCNCDGCCDRETTVPRAIRRPELKDTHQQRRAC